MLERIDPRIQFKHIGPAGLPRWNRALPETISKRVNPHLEARARLRIELRSKTVLATATKLKTEHLEKPVFSAADNAKTIFVVVDETRLWPGAEQDVLGASRELFPDDHLTLIVNKLHCTPSEAGADQVFVLTDLSTSTLYNLVLNGTPDHIVCGDGSAFSSIVRQLATRCKRDFVFNVVAQSNQKVTFTHSGGLRESAIPAPYLIALPRKTCAPYQGEFQFKGEVCPIQAKPEEPHFIDLGAEPLDVAKVPLKEAELVLSAGDGLSDWAAFHQAANLLGAAEAGSRVVCDNGHLPRNRQVGASGELIESKCYIALGISGAPQHLQGIQACQSVIAINTDIHAPIIKRANLAIIGDANLVVAELIKLMKKEAQI